MSNQLNKSKIFTLIEIENLFDSIEHCEDDFKGFVKDVLQKKLDDMDTIIVNGFKLPKPFKPKDGELYYYLTHKGTIIHDFYCRDSLIDEDTVKRGVYRTIKQARIVAEALPKILNGEML